MTLDEGPKLMRQLSNVRLGKQYWLERVKADEVMPALGNWRCGTQACFGGHLLTWPEFKAMGVYPHESAPKMRGCRVPADVADELFGDQAIFCTRSGHRADWALDQRGGVSDYLIVLNRLEYAEADLLRQIKELA